MEHVLCFRVFPAPPTHMRLWHAAESERARCCMMAAGFPVSSDVMGLRWGSLVGRLWRPSP